jgi:hypothetical protein
MPTPDLPAKTVAQRRARLQDLLPRVYATQPQGSAVGAVLDAMAQTLADFDTQAQRTLHDRWLALACGVPGVAPDDEQAALDRLGALLQIERLPARIRHEGPAVPQPADDGTVGLAVRFASAGDRDDALRLLSAPLQLSVYPVAAARIGGLAVRAGSEALELVFGADPTIATDAGAALPPLAVLTQLLVPEPTEAYRQRLQITETVTGRGLTTLRALLSLAIADLGAEPCPKFRRESDATVGRAVALGSRKRCAACANPALPCPKDAVFDAWITEQPAQTATWNVPKAPLHQVLTVRNDSLIADRPELTISANRKVSFPALQSLSSGEIVLFAGDLERGYSLRLLPEIAAGEAAAAVSHDRPVSHDWLQRSPRGRAELVKAATGQVWDVSDAIFYLSGNRYDEAASRLGGVGVDGMRFGVLEQAVRSPLLGPGDNDWKFIAFAAPVYRFDDETSTLAAAASDAAAHFALLDQTIATSDAKFAALLFQVLEKSNTAAAGDPDTAPVFTLDAQWVARPPFTFQLRVPKNAWVQAADLRGATALLLTDIERARPVGVRARVDFPEPVYRERQEPDEATPLLSIADRWAEEAGPADAPIGIAARSPGWTESHEPGEGALRIGALWSVTRFGYCVLQ